MRLKNPDPKTLTPADLYTDRTLWYNVIMDDLEIIETPVEQVKRAIAAEITAMGNKEVYSEYLAKKISYRSYLALVLWEAVTTGSMHFLEGQVLTISKYADWLDTVKFLATHLDGPVGNSINTQGINLFKVYMGIEEDRV